MVKRGTPSKGGGEKEKRDREAVPSRRAQAFRPLRAVFGLAPETRPRHTDCVCMSQRACRKGSAVGSWMTSVCGIQYSAQGRNESRGRGWRWRVVMKRAATNKAESEAGSRTEEGRRRAADGRQGPEMKGAAVRVLLQDGWLVCGLRLAMAWSAEKAAETQGGGQDGPRGGFESTWIGG